MQLERVDQLLASDNEENIVLGMKIIEGQITTKEDAIAAVVLLRKNNVEDRCPNDNEYYPIMDKLHAILSDDNNIHIVNIVSAGPKSILEFAFSRATTENDLEYAFNWYQDHVREIYKTQVKLKFRQNGTKGTIPDK